MALKKREKVIIIGAAGRDFHNFNVYYRDNEKFEVVAFTAAQIPDIAGRKYPPELSGKLYPNGIPILPEDELPKLIKKHDIDECVFSYSDISHMALMHKASMVIAAGADFSMLGATTTMIKSTKPVIAVCAVRTGCGKSQTTRRVIDVLRAKGKRVVAIRHPMPYGDLAKQAVQRFATYEDLDKHECTIEEREEYEPHIDKGAVVYAGVDYEKILREAEKEADVIVWDGGNNDLPFYKPDLHITVVDPHRPGHEIQYHPGEANLRMADVIIINKVDTAELDNIHKVRDNIRDYNPKALVIEAASPIKVEKPDLIKDKIALVIDDGPTITHGEMKYGAGSIAADKFGAKDVVDPRPFAVGSIIETFKKYPHIGKVLPAMGYGKKQIKELEKTIDAAKVDVVVSGTPIDISRVLKISKPIVRVRYDLQELDHPTMEEVLKKF